VSVRRIVSVAAVLVSLLAFAGVTPASGVGGVISPGQIKGFGQGGFASGFDTDSQISVFVDVSTGITTFRLRGGSLVTLDTSIVNVGINGFGAEGQGCWVIPSDMLVVSSDLSATLNFDSSDPRVTECPGDPIGSPILGSAPTLGPSGLVSGLQEPLRMTVTWVDAGPITSMRSTSRMRCKPFASVSEGSSRSVDSTTSGSAQGTFTDTGAFTAHFSGGAGNFFVGSSTTNVSGPPTGGCGPF